MLIHQCSYFAMPCAIRVSHFGNFSSRVYPSTDVPPRVRNPPKLVNTKSFHGHATAHFPKNLLPRSVSLRAAPNGVIAMSAGEPHQMATNSPDQIGEPVSTEDAAQALRDGPIGAFVVAGIAVGALLIAWLVFYFLLFIPRGTIG